MNQDQRYRNINTLADYDDLVNTRKLVVLLFVDEGRPACMTMLHTLILLLNKYESSFELGCVHTKQNHAVSRAFEVHTTPMIYLIEHQAIVECMTGLIPLKKVDELIASYLN